MSKQRTAFAAILLLLTLSSIPAQAQQCVPFARQVSAVSLRGDAWTWWYSATGKYSKGSAPEEGAVLVFRKTEKMRRGHVAVVSKVIHSRKVLVTHANWAPAGMGKGRVAKDMAVMDISPNNDWTQVKVWYQPNRDYGTRTYPTYGFIYSKKPHLVAAKLDNIAEANDVVSEEASPVKNVKANKKSDKAPAKKKSSKKKNNKKNPVKPTQAQN